MPLNRKDNTKSAQPCGCDEGAGWTCALHREQPMEADECQCPNCRLRAELIKRGENDALFIPCKY